MKQNYSERRSLKSLDYTLVLADIVARWGGEQFLIILMNIEPENSQALIEKIRSNIRYQIITEGLRDRVTTLSFGLAKVKENELFENTIKRADLSMYKAKKLGKDCIVNDE